MIMAMISHAGYIEQNQFSGGWPSGHREKNACHLVIFLEKIVRLNEAQHQKE